MEQVFCQKIKDLFAIRNLFDFKEWRNIYYLLKHLAPEYLNSYISAELQNDEKILRFLELSTRIWSGSFEKYYEVKDDYKEYLTEKRILQVIYNQKESGDLYSLPIKVQNICVTFYLTSCGKFTRLNQVSQTDIDELLSEWRKEYEKRDS